MDSTSCLVDDASSGASTGKKALMPAVKPLQRVGSGASTVMDAAEPGAEADSGGGAPRSTSGTGACGSARSRGRRRPRVPTTWRLLGALLPRRELRFLVVHAYLLKTAYIHTRNAVPNSLLAMYAAFGDPLAAAKVFDKMSLRDVISWTSMIGACLVAGGAPHALRLFNQLLADATLEVDGVVLVHADRCPRGTQIVRLFFLADV